MHSPVLAEGGGGKLKTQTHTKPHNVLLSFPFLEKVKVSNLRVKINKVFALAKLHTGSNQVLKSLVLATGPT